MPHAQTGNANHYALRVEGRAWLDDLTIEQIWAVLAAAFQQLSPRQELMFMIQMPNGAMPCRCLPRSVFELCIPTPAMLEDALSPLAPLPGNDGQYSSATSGRTDRKLAGLP